MLFKKALTSRVSEVDDIEIPRSLSKNLEDHVSPTASTTLPMCDRDQQKLWKNFDQLTHQNAITQLKISNIDNNHVFSASMDKHIVLWDIVARKVLRVFEGHTLTVSCIGIHGSSYENMILFSGGHDGECKAWRVSTGKCFKTFKSTTTQTISSPYV